MIRWLIIVGFILCFILALLLFLLREAGTLRDSVLQGQPSLAALTMTKLKVFRYTGEQPTSYYEAGFGAFKNPNIAEFRGAVRGWRLKDAQKQYLDADAATLYFSAKGFEAAVNSELEHAEFKGNVRFSFHDYRIYSEKAEYQPIRERLLSDEPIFLRGKSWWSSSNHGFYLDMKSENVELLGSVKGVFQQTLPK